MYSERWSDMDCVKIGDLVGGRFRITSVVGAGSFAWVFAAEDLHSGQTVALKMLRSERFGDGDALQRFEARELRLLERIESGGFSPFVVRLLEKRLLRHDGLPYLVLEYVDGPSLQEWLTQKGQLDIKEVARIGAGLARGLSVIHAAGGVHRACGRGRRRRGGARHGLRRAAALRTGRRPPPEDLLSRARGLARRRPLR